MAIPVTTDLGLPIIRDVGGGVVSPVKGVENAPASRRRGRKTAEPLGVGLTHSVSVMPETEIQEGASSTSGKLPGVC